MKTIWNEKRIKSGISKSDMANKLGVSIEKYILIEKGFVKMPSTLIDTFNSVIETDKHLLKLEQLEHEKEINNFCNYLLEKNEKGILNLDAKMQEFNVKNYEVLSKLLGYKSTCLLYTLKRGDKVGYDFKNKLYTFFNNELNIQPKTNDEKRNLVKNYDGKKYTLQYAFIRNSEFSPKTLKKIDAYFKSLEKTKETEAQNEKVFETNDLIFPELPENEENIKENDTGISAIEKVRGRIIDKQHKISQKQIAIGIEIANLRKEIEQKEQEYESLKNEINIYDDILNDLRNEE